MSDTIGDRSKKVFSIFDFNLFQKKGRRSDASSTSSEPIDRLNSRRDWIQARCSSLASDVVGNAARDARLRGRRFEIRSASRRRLPGARGRQRRVLGLGFGKVNYFISFLIIYFIFRNILLHNDRQSAPVGLVSSPNLNNNYHSYPKIDEAVSLIFNQRSAAVFVYILNGILRQF